MIFRKVAKNTLFHLVAISAPPFVPTATLFDNVLIVIVFMTVKSLEKILSL